MNTTRRFTGTQNLYGNDVGKFANAHIYVVGIGGVGSWVVEALARTGVGELTLIDMDILVESNINRQLPALSETFGESKIEVMKQRSIGINPNIKINIIDEFLTADNIERLLPSQAMIQEYKANQKSLIILDCVDDMNAKLLMALYCRFNKVKLIISGGAGGKIDPLQIKVADLKDVYQDPLLAKLRQKLKEKGINRHSNSKFGLKCVFSSEAIKMTKACESGLHCGGYGSAVVVTASVGMIMASECLKLIGNAYK